MSKANTDPNDAAAKAKLAKIFNIIGLSLGALIALIYIAIVIIAIASEGASNTTYTDDFGGDVNNSTEFNFEELGDDNSVDDEIVVEPVEE